MNSLYPNVRWAGPSQENFPADDDIMFSTADDCECVVTGYHRDDGCYVYCEKWDGEDITGEIIGCDVTRLFYTGRKTTNTKDTAQDMTHGH